MTRHNSSGFTLIEICVTILVFGIVLASVVYGTQRLIKSTRLTGATNTLVADLQYARSISTAQQRNIVVAFGTGSYSIRRVTPALVLKTRTYPAGVTFAASDTARFFPWGLSGAMSVTLSNTYKSNVLQLAANGNVTHP